MSDLTVADAEKWHMQEETHYNGGKVFFAYLHRCVEHPRLSRFDRYERKDRSVKSTWRTDGIDQPDFASAVAALNTPPVFTPEELVELAKVPEDWTDIRKTMDLTLNHALKNKGAIEWQKGRCRRRPSNKIEGSSGA